MKKWRKVLLILGAVFCFSFPFYLVWSSFLNINLESEIKSAYLEFAGSFLGTAIAAGISILGIILTVNSTKKQIDLSREQFNEQNRLNNQPILDLQITDILEVADEETIKMNCEYALDKNKNFQEAVVEFEVSNIGLGAAMDIRYGMKLDGVLQDGVFWGWKNNYIKSGCGFEQKLSICCPVDSCFSPDLVIFYDDILGDHYIKNIRLLNQQTEEGYQMMCILSQDKGNICDIEVKNNYYVISPTK